MFCFFVWDSSVKCVELVFKNNRYAHHMSKGVDSKSRAWPCLEYYIYIESFWIVLNIISSLIWFNTHFTPLHFRLISCKIAHKLLLLPLHSVIYMKGFKLNLSYSSQIYLLHSLIPPLGITYTHFAKRETIVKWYLETCSFK